MLNPTFFARKTLTTFLIMGTQKSTGMARKIFSEAEKNSGRFGKKNCWFHLLHFSHQEIFIFRPDFSIKKWRKPAYNGLSPFSSYKDNTFLREIQIALTLRNNQPTVNLRRFAADGAWHVLYYEADKGGIDHFSAQAERRSVLNIHRFRDTAKKLD